MTQVQFNAHADQRTVTGRRNSQTVLAPRCDHSGMPDRSPIRRLLLLTGAAAAVAVAVGLLRTTTNSPGTQNALGLIGVLAVMATAGFVWALINALRSGNSDG